MSPADWALPRKKTDRIDSTVTEVSVRRGNTSEEAAAVRHIRENYPEFKEALAVWMTGQRDGFNVVYAVEWITTEEESSGVIPDQVQE